MTKALVVTGFACSSAPWLGLLRDLDPVVVTLADLLDEAGRGDFRLLASSLDIIMNRVAHDVLVAHDLGLTIALLALRARRRVGGTLPSRLILFNGAFSGFDVFKAPHPLTLQLLTSAAIERRLQRSGVVLDPRLKDKMPPIRALYRQVIAASFLAKLQRSSAAPRGRQFTIPTLILEGVDDPYIPRSSIDELVKLFQNVTRVPAYQGHFPYCGDTGQVRSLIQAFIEQDQHGKF